MLHDTLSRVHTYFRGRAVPFEVILSDDGSTDSSLALVGKHHAEWPELRILANRHKGKGHGVYQGVMAAKGDFVYVCDADLSTPPEEFEKFWQRAAEGYEVVIGSREGAAAQRRDEPFFRHVMGRVFNLVVQMVALPGIQDSQCGFKLLRRDAAQDIFSRMHLYGDAAPELTVPAVTAFDVEMLFIARKLGYRIGVVPVLWLFKPSDLVHPVRDSLRNFSDVCRVRWNDMRGKYNSETRNSK